MNKKIILLSTFAILGVLVLGQAVYAANSTLSVLPSTASKNVGVAFNITVQISPQGNKVCLVKGTLSFNNLTCRSITIASGLMAQTTPTCASPSFILGIPKCATVTQNVLTASVKGNNVGQAKASLTGSSVIGVGVLIPSDSQGGAYNITAVPAPVPTPAPGTVSPTSTPTPTETPALFDITSEPVLPARPSVIPVVVFSAVAGILFILFAIFVRRRIRMYMIAKRIKENIKKDMPADSIQKVKKSQRR